jgi:hypothetical protein
MNYQRVYGVTLMDDIHNYFPAILYEQNRFNSVADLLGYVRSQMRRHFDLFSNQTRMYTADRAAPPAAPVAARATPRVRVHVPHMHVPHLERQSSLASTSQYVQQTGVPRSEVIWTNLAVPVESDPIDSSLGNQLIRELLGSTSIASIINEFSGLASQPMTPVIVRPSAQQIATASTVTTVDAEASTTAMCAICQDSISPGTSARRLTACTHTFHTGCIDTWFTSHVCCPVCRHDIREA